MIPAGEDNLNHGENLIRFLPRKSLVAFLIKAVGLSAGFLFTFLVSRYYGAGTYGLFSLGLNAVQVFVLFAVMGFDTTLLRLSATTKENEQRPHLPSLFSKMAFLSVPLGLLFTFLLWFCAPALSEQVFNKPALEPVLKLLSWSILPAGMMLIQASGLRGMNDTGWFSFFRESSRFLLALPFLVVAIVLVEKNPLMPSLSYTIAVILSFVWSLLIWRKRLSGPGHAGKLNPGFRELLTLSGSFLLINALAQFFPLLNILLLGMLGSAEDVGIFQVALKVAGLLSLPLLAGNMAGATVFAAFHQSGQAASIQRAATHSARMIFFTSLPLLILCLAIPGPVMRIFGSSFGEGATALILVSIAQFINAVSGSVGVLMQMTGLERVWTTILSVSTVVNLTGLFILIPGYGLNGAAASYLAVMLVNNLTGMVILKKRRNIRSWYLPFVRS